MTDNLSTAGRDSLTATVEAAIKDIPHVEIEPSDAESLATLAKRFPEGCDVTLLDGEYIISEPIRIVSNMRFTGAGVGRTILTLAPGSNCHMFVNEHKAKHTRNFFANNFSVVGNGDEQTRAADVKGLTFACAFYLGNMSSIVIHDMDFYDIRQTALHFSRCTNVIVRDVSARRLGWSGVSSSGTSNAYIHADVSDAGRDIRHSAIHMDGGFGVFVDARVSETTGNGIMLDSAFSPMRGAAVQGSATKCMRGVSLSGSNVNELADIVIRGNFYDNQHAGIMVSNASHVSIIGAYVHDNEEYGVLFQGRTGGRNSIVVDCDIGGNGTDVGQVHASHTNWIFPPLAETVQMFSSPLNHRAMKAELGASMPWFQPEEVSKR